MLGALTSQARVVKVCCIEVVHTTDLHRDCTGTNCQGTSSDPDRCGGLRGFMKQARVYKVSCKLVLESISSHILWVVAMHGLELLVVGQHEVQHALVSPWGVDRWSCVWCCLWCGVAWCGLVWYGCVCVCRELQLQRPRLVKTCRMIQEGISQVHPTHAPGEQRRVCQRGVDTGSTIRGLPDDQQ
jgi:hypothetical protein